jgi:UDP-3-O-[3-hydroxymyristoyl] glucosamine N-acyltransferase
MIARFTVREIAARVSAELFGAGETLVEGVASLSAVRPGCIVFVEKERDLAGALESPAAAIVTSVLVPQPDRPAILYTPNVRRTFAEVCSLLSSGYPRDAPGVHPTAVVDRSAEVDTSAAVGPHVVIGAGCRVGAGTVLRAGVVLDEGATIGSDCYLFQGAVVGRRSVLGDRCVIYPNAVIGGEGFGYTEGDGTALKQPQFGRVVLGDDCEVGAGSIIDRGTLDDTVLGNDVKLDNLVQIAHNCTFGNHIRVAAQCGFSGGVRVEDDCMFGGQVGVQNRVTIGRGSEICGQAGVTGDVPPGSRVWGLPARNQRDVVREMLLVRRLPELLRRIDTLEAREQERRERAGRSRRDGTARRKPKE